MEDKEETVGVLGVRAVRGLLLLIMSIGTWMMACYAAFGEGKWDKAIFFLLCMMVIGLTLQMGMSP